MKSLVMVLAMLVLIACYDEGEPSAPTTVTAESRDPTRMLRPGLTLDAKWRAIDQVSPGFAGIHVDPSGTPIISVTRAEAIGGARAYLTNSRSAVAGKEPLVRFVPFSFVELDDWRGDLFKFGPPGAVFFDVDEAENVVLLGVEDLASVEGVQEFMLARDIPAAAVRFRVLGPGPHDRLSLRFHGGHGGTAFEKPSGAFCTLGISGVANGSDVFVSAAHCSGQKFQPDGIPVEQKWGGVVGSGSSTVADEWLDPTYAQVGVPCTPWPGTIETCRLSDAALFKWRQGANYEHYRIIETTFVRPDYPLYPQHSPGSHNYLNLPSGDARHFVVTDAVQDWDELYAGLSVDKVGQRTGWTRGPIKACIPGASQDAIGQQLNCLGGTVTSTCFNYRFTGTNTYLACQYEAWLYSDDGDSGAPVFLTGESRYPLMDDPTPTVKLAGILWGGPAATSNTEVPLNGGPYQSNDGDVDEDENYTWFSPWPGVVWDLGFVDVCHPAGALYC